MSEQVVSWALERFLRSLVRARRDSALPTVSHHPVVLDQSRCEGVGLRDLILCPELRSSCAAWAWSMCPSPMS